MSEVLTKTPVIALVGNPNTGKTTLFNALTGLSQRTGNFPGVTVEKKTGALTIGEVRSELVDLPGTYSLAAASPDELVVADFLLRESGEGPVDGIVVVADACTLHRNLYLVTQIMELGIPTVMALNMTDLADERQIKIDVPQLSQKLGIPVVATNAASGKGLSNLRGEVGRLLDRHPNIDFDLFPDIHDAAKELIAASDLSTVDRHGLEHDTFRALLDESNCSVERIAENDPELSQRIEAKKRELTADHGRLIEYETKTRYGWIREQLVDVLTVPEERVVTLSDRVDKILTHKVMGMAALLLVLAVIFQTLFKGAAPFMDGVEAVFSALGDSIGAILPDGTLKSLITDGVIAGVGGVLVFLPQIIFLFLFIAVLEDCGYMARAAFLMDRIFKGVGLSGKSLIPLLSSFACAIPGLMATRSIEDRRDRLATIFVAPFMSCSARLPVYVIMIAAFIPDRKIFGPFGLQGLTLLAMYLVGVCVAVPTAWLLKRTLLKGTSQPFIMELPAYKMPSFRTVGMRVYISARAFILRAGTVILAVSIVIWALGYFPRSTQVAEKYQNMRDAVKQELATQDPANFGSDMALDDWTTKLKAIVSSGDEASYLTAAHEKLGQIEKEENGAYLEESLLGRVGHHIEPIVEPLGWDWRIGVGALASFPAREVIISTLGIIYNLGSDEDEESTLLRETISKTYGANNVPLALSIMVFFALCAQCAATLAVIRKEAGGWHWAGLSFVYMTSIAYLASMATYHLTSALGWGS